MLKLKKLWIIFLIKLELIIKSFFLFLVAFYRSIGTTYLGGSCRFEPSCSQYAVECLHQHKFYAAIPLILSRVFRCRPGGSFGYDPVPKANYKKENF